MRAHRARLAAANLLLVLAVGCNAGADEPDPAPQHDYVTVPDREPPVIDVTTHNGEAGRRALADKALFFLAPKDGDSMTGPMIVDSEGRPVWIGPDVRGYDLRVQKYHGKPVLTWWRQADTPLFDGEVVIMNSSYRRIATVTTRGMPSDPHVATLAPRGTALLLGYRLVRRDLRNYGGPSYGWVRNDIVQEVDVATGRVLFSWSAIKHIPLTDGRIREDPYGTGESKSDPWDYVHINSVTVDGDALLISARNTSAIYRVDRKTGDVDWTLGGRSSDFRFVGGSRFSWQHDAQRQPDGTITLFDNHGSYDTGGASRGLRLRWMFETTRRPRSRHIPSRADGWAPRRGTWRYGRTGMSSSDGARARTTRSSPPTVASCSMRTSAAARATGSTGCRGSARRRDPRWSCWVARRMRAGTAPPMLLPGGSWLDLTRPRPRSSRPLR